jgi:hypothetical protein
VCVCGPNRARVTRVWQQGSVIAWVSKQCTGIHPLPALHPRQPHNRVTSISIFRPGQPYKMSWIQSLGRTQDENRHWPQARPRCIASTRLGALHRLRAACQAFRPLVDRSTQHSLNRAQCTTLEIHTSNSNSIRSRFVSSNQISHSFLAPHPHACGITGGVFPLSTLQQPLWHPQTPSCHSKNSTFTVAQGGYSSNTTGISNTQTHIHTHTHTHTHTPDLGFPSSSRRRSSADRRPTERYGAVLVAMMHAWPR